VTKSFGAAFGIGIAVIAIAVAGVLYMQRDARVGLAGNFLKVRTAPLDETSSVAAIDFRYRNPAYVRFVVREVTVILEDATGNRIEGRTVSEIDAQRLFEGLPILGQKFNKTLMTRDAIGPHAEEDRMVAARFEVPEAKLDTRKRFILRIEDVDGPVTEISEK
jgi:hypothetical protein